MQGIRITERVPLNEGWSQDEQQTWLALLARIGAGDRDALADLYARFQRPLFRYLCQLTPDRGLAEEILQDTFVAVWKSAGKFEGRSSVRTWVFGVARRQAHNTLRRRGVPLADEDALAEAADPGPAVEDRVIGHAAAEELARAVGSLAPIHREVLVLSFVHGLPYHEIAQIVGVPEGTVKSRLSNAKRALRELLQHM